MSPNSCFTKFTKLWNPELPALLAVLTLLPPGRDVCNFVASIFFFYDIVQQDHFNEINFSRVNCSFISCLLVELSHVRGS